MLFSLLRLEYLGVLDSLLRLEYLLAGASELSLQLPYLVVVSVSLLNASLQLVRPPDSNLDPPLSYLAEAACVGPVSVLTVLAGRLEYLGREELESEEARLVRQLLPDPPAPPYFPPLEESGVVPLL